MSTTKSLYRTLLRELLPISRKRTFLHARLRSHVSSSAPSGSDTVELNCWLEGDQVSFPITTDKKKRIGHLKEAILVKNPGLVSHAHKLELYRVNFPDGTFTFDEWTDGRLLRLASKTISEAFEAPLDKKNVHVAIKKPEPPAPAVSKEKSVTKDGLPPLGRRIGTTSMASKNHHHEPAKIRDSKLGLIHDLTLGHGGYGIWVLYQESNEVFEYAAEATIAKYVSVVIQGIINGMGQAGKIKITEELEFNALRPDIWVIHENGFPIGVVEIKKPSGTILENEVLGGQMLDYLWLLSSFYGISTLFGIATTYQKWRFFWTEDTDEVAQAEHIQEQQPTTFSRELPDTPDWSNQTADMGSARAPQNDTRNRIICASHTYDYSDSSLPRAIASVLRKMQCSPRHPVALVDGRRAYLSINNSWTWVKLPQGFSLKFCKSIHPNARQFSLLMCLGSGVEGLSWLASTSSGSACVIKLTKEIMNAPSDQLKAVADRWRQIWGIPARAQIMDERGALITPYVRMCTDKDFLSDAVCTSARAAVVHMVDKGYRHNDLAVRHVGLYRDEEGLHAIFIDLSDVSVVSKGDTTAKDYMLEKLGLPKAQ